MNTNYFPTFGTNPFLIFITNEMFDSGFLYQFEVIDHAHSILGSVSLIQLFQPGAGKPITTIRTILGFAVGDLFTVSDSTCGSAF
ncbi:MAG: hypothetical protein ABIK15_11355 [Pseudomonadota bacterium]